MALASVGCCVRLQLPLVSISSSCAAEAGYRGDTQGGGCGLTTRAFLLAEKAALQSLSASIATAATTTTTATTATTITTTAFRRFPNCHLREPQRTNGEAATPEAQHVPDGKRVPAPPPPYQGPHEW